MKIKKITTILVALAVLAIPVVSFANTYQYVDSRGQLQSIEANSSSEALMTAYNIGIHSGVMLVSSQGIGGGDYTGSFYQFVDMSGNIQSMDATNSSTALTTAYNIGTHSGVILVNNYTQLY